MTHTPRRGALSELATLHGLQTSYLGADEATRTADPDVLVSMLQRLGVDIVTAKDAPRLIDEQQRRVAQRPLEPVLVVRDEHPLDVAVTLPSHLDPTDAWLTMAYEDGRVDRQRLPHVTPTSRIDLDGRSFLRYDVPLRPRDATSWDFGYHALSLEVGGDHSPKRAPSLVISAPRCPLAQHGWGVFIPQHALRTSADWGVGSYSDLAELGTWIAGRGGSMMGGLPLYPSFLTPPIDPSPYRPVSRLAYNELYIDPTVVPELTISADARELLASRSFQERLDALRTSTFVDYEGVARVHFEVLARLTSAFFSGESTRRHEFEAFMDQHPELSDYAQFRASVDRVGYHATNATPIADVSPQRDDDAWRYYAYTQWVAAQQLTSATERLALYADLPVGSHPQGFDPYWSPKSFIANAKCGSPPDLFLSDGQDWGLPPLHPEAIRDDHYRYLRAVLARAVRHASFLRIDHVMGLERLYVMAEDADPHHGVYVSYHADELHALVSLEASRHDAVVIGEDLGTVAAGVRERMADDHMLRTWVFEFESTTEDPLPEPPAEFLANLSTHDMPRFSAFLWGRDIDEAERLGHYSSSEAQTRRAERALYRDALFAELKLSTTATDELTDAARRGCLEHLAKSHAALVQIDLEELWGEDEQQNHPGTTEGNWRRRAKRTLEAAMGDDQITAMLDLIDQERRTFAA